MTYSGGTPRKEADVRGALMGTPLYLGGDVALFYLNSLLF